MSRRRHRPQILAAKASGARPVRSWSVVGRASGEMSQALAHFHDNLIPHEQPIFVLLGPFQVAKKPRQGDVGVDDDWSHVRHGLQVRVDVHRVENAEDFLADMVGAARGPADHLVVEDAAVHPADEDQGADLRDVDAGGEEVHRHHVFGVRIVAEAADLVRGVVDRAGDLLHEVVRLRAMFCLERLAQVPRRGCPRGRPELRRAASCRACSGAPQWRWSRRRPD